jgi:hypothetical protein
MGGGFAALRLLFPLDHKTQQLHHADLQWQKAAVWRL